MGKLSYFISFVIYFVSNNKITSGKCLNLVLCLTFKRRLSGILCTITLGQEPTSSYIVCSTV